MKCPYCQHETRVTNSRPQLRRNSIWRRRLCTSCGAVFTSTEHIDLEKSLMVEHAGALSPFLRDKLFVSLYDSVRHRKTALSDATALTDTVISQVFATLSDGQTSRSVIARLCHEVLKRFDSAAAVHYQAYHPVTNTER